MAEKTAGGKKFAGISWKWWLIGGIGTAGIVYFTYRKSANSAATTSDTSATDTTDSSIDPATGIPYAEEYASDSGYSAIPSEYGYTDPYGNTITQGTGTTSTVTAPGDNASWAQEVESYFANNLGADPTTVSAALGKYLTGQNLTADQLSLVETALAFMGNPPQSVPSPHTAPSTGQTSTTLPTVANGYYRDSATGTIWSVNSETRNRVTSATWNKIYKQAGKPHPILPNSNVYKLPRGKDI